MSDGKFTTRPDTGTRAWMPREIPRRVSQPGDAHEREADSVAAAVVRGAGLPRGGISVGSVVAGSAVQRDGGEAPKNDADKYKEGLEKVGEAFLETPLGKKLKEKVTQDPLVKGVEDFAGTLHGKVIIGSAAAGTIAALAASGAELPMQVPEIPLDALTPGLKLKLTYEGPVDNPTKAMITFSYTEQVKKTDRPAQTRAERQRAENARVALEQQRFRDSLQYPPGSPQALERAAQERAIRDIAFGRVGTLPGVGEPDLYPGLAHQPRAYELQLPGIWRPRPISLLDGGLELKSLDEVSGASTDLKKKEDAGGAVQRKAQGSRAPDVNAAAVDRGLGSSGQRLEPDVRSFMESRLEHSLEHVRVHADAQASQSARALDAQAYTVGPDIVFAEGRYTPRTSQGRELLAHELTHVLQQGPATPAATPRAARTASHEPADRDDRAPDEASAPPGGDVS